MVLTLPMGKWFVQSTQCDRFFCVIFRSFRIMFSHGQQPQTEGPACQRTAARTAGGTGADALSHAELIAILLRTGLKGANAVEIGQATGAKIRLVASAGAGVRGRFAERQGHRARQGGDAGGGVRAGAANGGGTCSDESPVLDNPENVVRLLREKNLVKNVETFQVLLLNTRRRLIRVEEITDGTIDTMLVHPREVFRAAIAANAAAVVLVHNHPSGDPTPSEADIKVTRDLIRAGQFLKIEVLDHVIIGRATPERPKDYASLRELGYFYS